MPHKFVIRKNGILETYTEYKDIPHDFEHVIEFNVEVPPDPHTEEQHEEIEKWNDRLQALMKIERENASSNKNR